MRKSTALNMLAFGGFVNSSIGVLSGTSELYTATSVFFFGLTLIARAMVSDKILKEEV